MNDATDRVFGRERQRPAQEAGELRRRLFTGTVNEISVLDAAATLNSSNGDIVRRVHDDAPAGTPPEIVRKLNEEFVKAANAPEVVQKIAAQAVDITTSTTEEFAKLLASDIDRLGNVIRDAGIKAQ
jgi:Tripartite tricarboxylate transporter family receptor